MDFCQSFIGRIGSIFMNGFSKISVVKINIKLVQLYFPEYCIFPFGVIWIKGIQLNGFLLFLFLSICFSRFCCAFVVILFLLHLFVLGDHRYSFLTCLSASMSLNFSYGFIHYHSIILNKNNSIFWIYPSDIFQTNRNLHHSQKI